MVIAEGMAAQRVVVAARGGGAAELFEDGVTAMGYPPGDADALASRLAQLIEDRAGRDAIAVSARGAALERLLAGAHGRGVPRGLRRMISIGLCAAAFLACVYMGRKSLVAGLCTLMAVGYAYGIVRANLPDGFSHLIFDAGTLGLYAAQLTRPSAGVAAHAVRGRAQLADRADCVADVPVRHALAGSADSAGGPARQHLPAAVRAARLAAHRRRRLQAGAVVRRVERRRGRCWRPSSSPSASSRSSRATPSPI